MSLDCDFVLVGSGLAPLIAASHLIESDHRVLVLNPDTDFFQENSELGFDPLLPRRNDQLRVSRIEKNIPDRALEALRPEYPGALQFISIGGGKAGSASDDSSYRDLEAPYVRSRARIWVESKRSQTWDQLEEMSLRAVSEGLKPQELTGAGAFSRFPGFSNREQDLQETKAIFLPRLVDVDLNRFRNGLLEFTRQRVGDERVLCGVSQLEFVPDGVRFHVGKGLRTSHVKSGMLVFWTPRMDQWIESSISSKQESRKVREQIEATKPVGVRVWEEWKLMSKESLDISTMGVFEDMVTYCDIEGYPIEDRDHLTLGVLKSGKLVPRDQYTYGRSAEAASVDSFHALSRLLHEFLGWDKFSVREMRPKTIAEWKLKENIKIPRKGFELKLVAGCDGPLLDVVSQTKHALAEYL